MSPAKFTKKLQPITYYNLFSMSEKMVDIITTSHGHHLTNIMIFTQKSKIRYMVHTRTEGTRK